MGRDIPIRLRGSTLKSQSVKVAHEVFAAERVLIIQMVIDLGETVGHRRVADRRHRVGTVGDIQGLEYTRVRRSWSAGPGRSTISHARQLEAESVRRSCQSIASGN